MSYQRLIETPSKNILIVGVTGSGKASIANAILDKEVFPVGTSIHSFTRRADFVVEEHLVDYFPYKIGIVDTVGVADERNVRRNIKDALEQGNLTSLNLIIFVFKHERFFTHQEQRSFNQVMTVLNSRIPDASSITTLVVTYCEQKDEEAREKIEKDLGKEGAPTKDIVDFVQSKVLLVGLPKLSEVSTPLLSTMENRRTEDSKKLKKMVEESNAPK